MIGARDVPPEEELGEGSDPRRRLGEGPEDVLHEGTAAKTRN